jgi:MraZ protein
VSFSGAGYMFRGRSKHNLDDKGRLAIPSRFKEVLDQKGDDYLIVTNHDDCLWAYPRDKWREVEEKAAKLPESLSATTTYVRYFISGAVECQLKNGRITIPPDLREIAELKKEVVLVGAMQKFEIWDKEKWDQEFQRAKGGFSQASEAVTAYNI